MEEIVAAVGAILVVGVIVGFVVYVIGSLVCVLTCTDCGLPLKLVLGTLGLFTGAALGVVAAVRIPVWIPLSLGPLLVAGLVLEVRRLRRLWSRLREDREGGPPTSSPSPGRGPGSGAAPAPRRSLRPPRTRPA